MAKTATTKSGRTTDISGDAKFNLATQNPSSIDHAIGGLTVNSDLSVGVPFLIHARCVTAAALKAVVTYTATVFNKDCPFKLEVVSIRARLVSYTQTDWTDADGGNLDVTVQDGDGAASESFTDVLADQAFDDTYTDGMQVEYPSSSIVLTNTTIGAGESLKCLLIADPDDTIVAGAGAGVCTVDFYIECVRVK